ncbi:MAG: protein kinase, partial [Acidobacteriota bacterium]
MTSPQLGNYSNLSVVGEDALGVLYQGRDTTSGQTVTILVFEGMQPGGSAVAEQLKAAWAQLGALGHPGIALPLDHGEESGRLYLVEERVEGESLESLIARGAGLPVEQRVGIMIQAAEALGFAHARGIVHQSLAPSRIHLLPDGRVKTAGFLIGRLMLSSSNRPGIRWGGRIYLSPEQISGLQADSRSDVFALGLIFYELLTHTHPFHDANSAKVLDNILHRTTFPTIDQFADLPLGLWAIIERCLAKRPEERFAGGAELAAACRQLHKDIADDRQLMLVELHTMLPRLSEAARRPEAPEVLGRLQREVQQLLASERVAEYVPLNRMISALSAHYRTIHSIFEEPPTLAEGYGIEAPAMDDAADGAAQDSFDVAEAVLSSCIFDAAGAAAESAEPAHEPAGLAESAIPPLPGFGHEMDIPASGAPAADTGSPENYGLPAEPRGSAAPASADAGVFAGPQPAMSAAVPGPGEGSPDAFPPMHGLRDRLPEEPFPWSAPSYPLEAPDARGDQPPVPGWNAQETSAVRPADGEAELSPFLEAMRQDFPPPEAESPVETTGDPAASGFDWWSGTDEQPETTVPPLPAETASGRGWRQVRRMARRHGPKVVLAAAGLVVVAGAVALLASVRSQRGLFVILADARQFLTSRIFGEGEPRITKLLAGAPSSSFVLPVPGGEADGPALEVLVEQGRLLRELGRYEESGVFLQRAIEIDPDHEPAQAENQALQAAVAEQRGQFLDDEKLRRAVADVTALIAAGNLAQAKTALNRMERDWPGQSRIARLK